MLDFPTFISRTVRAIKHRLCPCDPHTERHPPAAAGGMQHHLLYIVLTVYRDVDKASPTKGRGRNKWQKPRHNLYRFSSAKMLQVQKMSQR